MITEQLRHLIKRSETKTSRLSTHIEFADDLDAFFTAHGRELLKIVEAHEQQAQRETASA